MAGVDGEIHYQQGELSQTSGHPPPPPRSRGGHLLDNALQALAAVAYWAMPRWRTWKRY